MVCYRYNQKDEYILSAHLETLDEIQNQAISKTTDVTAMELAVAIMSGKINTWHCYKVIYSKKVQDYITGRVVPKIHRVGSNSIPVPARRIFGNVRNSKGRMVKENRKMV